MNKNQVNDIFARLGYMAFGAALIILGELAINAPNREVEAQAGRTWQYRDVYCTYGKDFPAPELDELGQSGWEAFAVSSNDRGCRYVYLKRAL